MKSLLVLFFTLCLGCSILAQTQIELKISDGILHVTTFGEGPALVVINGGPGMSSNGFVGLAESLCETNTVILFDQRGTGKSVMNEVSAKTITMDLMVADMEVIRKNLGFEEWIVMGHSFGGMLASYYTSKFPERVKGLILSSSGGLDLSLLNTLNITARLSQKDQDSLNFWNNKIRNGDTSFHASLQRGTYLAPAYLYDNTHRNKIAQRLTEGNSQINSLVWQNLRAINYDCKKEIETYKKPVLIIQGAQDIIDKNIATSSHRLFSNSDLVFIDNCAHYGWLEQPEVYYGSLNRFLMKVAG
ncbi:proline iminopeptidase [Ulvibacter sp. MAR_2010_11]|uniref:alpha/beta fold hydrolase n=1 Tax=Ulvibacter sp. MAR_2010_11 TaxID=1250229 RepID=UPI000C2B9C51|nr:alpha/beta fold hydrolase [Ulvibacter sp. MAR_2010_11]PKA84222.1 proline iminopeptidase [Ulvibacter sp. MAR_2010_11]